MSDIAKLGGGPTVNLVEVQRRMAAARVELSKADRPGETPQGTHNFPGQNDGFEAQRGTSPLAKAAWLAGREVWGSQAVTGGREPKDLLFPKVPLTAQDLEYLENQALRILNELVAPGTKEVPRERLEALPQQVDAYWKNTFGVRAKLQPAQRDAMVAFIRAAIEE